MQDLQNKIQELKLKNQQLKDEITLLKQANEALIRDKKFLKAVLKKSKLQKNGFIRQGIRYLDINEPYWAIHYYVLKIEGIPLNVDILIVQELIIETLKKDLSKDGKFSGYKITSFNYSNRSEAWYVQIEKVIDTKLLDLNCI